jgi:hypothetical protein
MKTLFILVLTALMLYAGVNICMIGMSRMERISTELTTKLNLQGD